MPKNKTVKYVDQGGVMEGRFPLHVDPIAPMGGGHPEHDG
jgi:hypothetical protein